MPTATEKRPPLYELEAERIPRDACRELLLLHALLGATHGDMKPAQPPKTATRLKERRANLMIDTALNILDRCKIFPRPKHYRDDLDV